MKLDAKMSLMMWPGDPSLTNNLVIDRNPEHLYYPFRQKVERVIKAANETGLNVGLYEGFRSLMRQAELMGKGRRLPWEPIGPVTSSTVVTRAFPGEGLHFYGLAVDLVFHPEIGFLGGWNPDYDWPTLGKIGKAEGLVWGGDSRSQDLCHFEWPIPSGANLKKLYLEGGLLNVWKALKI